MRLKDASKLVTLRHIEEAARLVDAEGQPWLLARTGRHEPKTRYIVAFGNRYPVKAFGFLCAQLAGGTDSKDNDMNVNEAVAPLRRLGLVEVRGFVRTRTPEQEEARLDSYYRTLARPQQAAFRRLLLGAFGATCAITRNRAAPALQAAHITPFSSSGSDTLDNGILLRADLHLLFDSGDLAIDPTTLTAHFSPRCRSDYSACHGTPLLIPEGGPIGNCFTQRWSDFNAASA